MFLKYWNRINSISKIKFYWQRTIKEENKRMFYANKIAKKVGKTSSFEGTSILNEDIDLGEFNENGCIRLGKILSPEDINNLKDAVKEFKCFDPFKPELGEFFIADASEKVHVANYKREDLITVPQIMKLANDPRVLNAVQDFLGLTPTISNINMWWSLAGRQKAEQAQNFHRDVDDFKFCKIFFYLTDVEKEDGPHVFVKKSHSSPACREIRRYTDEEVADAFGEENILYFTAEKGNAFIVNTYGMHKGLLPQNNDRLLLQVQYSLQPIGIENYSPKTIHDTSVYNKYVNRLLIK